MAGNILAQIREEGFSLERLTEHCPELVQLKDIPQNPEYHGEGNVYRHTKMVCQALKELSGWGQLAPGAQELLFLAAAFHDIGKAVCTRMEEGEWISPRHALVGEKLFRETVYRAEERFRLTFNQREAVAGLIRYHGLPVWFWSRERPEQELVKAAERVPLKLLYLLSMADVLGRKGRDIDRLAGQVEFFSEYARETEVWEGPYGFSGPYTRFQYFQKEDLGKEAALFDDTQFDVVLMSGLPLAGKDTWIGHHGMGRPVISLDDIREEMGIAPGKDSGKVACRAMEQARIYLRRKEPFIWNATNIVRDTRQKLVRLWAGYGARVHIRYLEVPYLELLARNRKRERHIPEAVLEKMIGKLEIPAPWEAYEVLLPGQ